MWGEWIEIEGKRPEWLSDDDEIQWLDDNFGAYDEMWLEDHRICVRIVKDWDRKTAIRLVAEHGVYKLMSGSMAGSA